MSDNRLKEKILYLKLKQRDRQAFITAYDLYLDNIYRFIYFRVSSKEEAEDITSSVFLKSWDYIRNNSLKDHKTLKSLFYKIAHNAVIDHYRKKSQQPSVSLDCEIKVADMDDENQDMAKSIELADDIKLLENIMFEMKDEYREVITLRYINELSIAEIAEILDKSKGNVRVLIYRAINALRELAGEKYKITDK